MWGRCCDEVSNDDEVEDGNEDDDSCYMIVRSGKLCNSKSYEV